MPSSPTSQLRNLTLESMSPEEHSRARADSRATDPEKLVDDESSSESDSDSDSDSSDSDDEDSGAVHSPSKLTYLVDHLPEPTRTAVRDAFEDPPQMALQKCRLVDNTYAFQMTEMVTRSVRIRAPEAGAPRLTCSCGVDEQPCEHLLWLLDQITKHSTYGHDLSKPLKMTTDGYPEEMGDPFRHISNHHLDVLADEIHCHMVNPDGEDDEVDTHRVEEARELLASVYAESPDVFRPDIFTRPLTGKRAIKRRDLDRTVFRMLLDNDHFFHYFYSLSRPTDPINDPFRKLLQRHDHILRDLDSYSSNGAVTPPETSRNVAWAATHIIGIVRLVKDHIYSRDSPLSSSEALSAVRCLINIFEAVIARNRDAHPGASRRDRNLYLRLIGDRDEDFIIGVLGLLPEAASQFLHNLEVILETLGVHGAPAAYVARFQTLISRLRTSSMGSALKRSGPGNTATGRSTKRKK